MDESTAAPPTDTDRLQVLARDRRQLITALTGVAALTPAMARAVEPQRLVASDPYRLTGARHLYKAHTTRIFKGKLPPLLYAIAIIETQIDEQGYVVGASVVREPAAAKEVSPWVLSLICAASPFPKTGRSGRTVYRDIWLVDRSYTFQLDALTEGQL